MKELPGGVPEPAENIGTFMGGPPPCSHGEYPNVNQGPAGLPDTEIGGERFTEDSEEAGPGESVDDDDDDDMHQTFQQMKNKWS